MEHFVSSWRRNSWCWVAMSTLVGALVGCATYRPLDLPAQVRGASALSELHGAAALPRVLGMADVERLVLLNNPDLRSARASHQVAQAQLLQAGLLPNPQVNASAGFLVSGVGDATAWTAGLSEDVRALVTLKPRREAARATAAQVDAGLLWQEWQTLAKARLLVIDIVQGERQRDLLQRSLSLLDELAARVQRSVAEGNGELAAAAPVLAAAADARTSVDDLQRRVLSQRHELAALLGLAPDAEVPLDPQLQLPVLDVATVRARATDIARRRPDLVALQLGYQAQEASLRAAVLAQFPALSFGYAAAQDNSRVRNAGPSISFELPLFDRNQGNIAVATATRQQLHDEFRSRLLSAHNELAALLSEQAQARAQFAALQPQLGQTARAAAQAQAAFRQGNIDSRSEVDFGVAALTRQVAAMRLEQNLLEQQVALATLVGAGLPTSLPEDVIAP
jgi:outer membrane protein TolC